MNSKKNSPTGQGQARQALTEQVKDSNIKADIQICLAIFEPSNTVKL